MKKLIVINCIIISIMAAAFLLNSKTFNNQALAQDSRAASGSFRVAVVNFSEIMKRSRDVINLQEYIATIGQLKARTERNLEQRMRIAEENLRMFENDPNRDQNQDYRDILEGYTLLAAEYTSLKDIFEFRQKSELVTFSKLFLDKLLSKIQNYSTGRFDMVFKVVNPEAEDLEKMGDAMQLQLEKAKDILFYDKSKVVDITKEINRLIDNDRDERVTIGIELAKDKLQKEIAAISN